MSLQPCWNGLGRAADWEYSVPTVIFHCGSSKERGPKCAGWYQDYLALKGCDTSKAYVLVGGIKAWRDGGYPSIMIQ